MVGQHAAKVMQAIGHRSPESCTQCDPAGLTAEQTHAEADSRVCTEEDILQHHRAAS